MISAKDLEIIAHLRKNARQKVTAISRSVKIPVTTIYDKIRSHERKFIRKHTTLLDFSKLGLHTHAAVAIKVDRKARDQMQSYLMDHPGVNTLYKTNPTPDFVAEVIFPSALELQDFTEYLESQFLGTEISVFNVVEELKKESFLTEPSHMIAEDTNVS